METLVHANPIGYAYAAMILWLIILGPFLALWIVLSVRRDIHRIADALDGAAQVAKVYNNALDRGLCIVSQEDAGRVSNSAFGR